MDVSFLQRLEAAGAHAKLEQLLGRLITSSDPQIYQFAARYFVRRGKPTKTLQYYSQYLSATTPAERNLDAVAMAIDCAKKLGKNSTVLEYFFVLTPQEREKLPSETLCSVAQALIGSGRLAEAQAIADFLHARSGIPPLPDFASYIRSHYGDRNAVREFIKTTSADFTAKATTDSIEKAIALAIAHIAEGNYQAAITVAERCKAALAQLATT